MRRVLIVQARMTSTRLPGKVLMDVAGRPMLAQQLRRLTRCASVDELVVATTTNTTDDPVAALAASEGVSCFRGSEHDVLGRFVGAAHAARADVVVRVTADCPLIDPEVTDRVIDELVTYRGECDYASNVERRSYPRGLDVEALFFDTLLRVDRLGCSTAAREHVTVFIRGEHPELFLRRAVTDSKDASDLRWTVDTAADLQLIRILYERLDLEAQPLAYDELLAYVRTQPSLTELNVGVETWHPKPRHNS